LTLSKSQVNSRKGQDQIETQRLLLRKPLIEDVDSIFSRYASDPTVTRYMSWPMHRSVADTKAFLAWSDADWAQWPAGSYLVFERDPQGRLLGGTGLSFVSLEQAITGYVFARDAWGFGFATESMQAMVALARSLGVRRLEAVCHVDHRASARVLEKCGFVSDGVVPAHTEFVNLNPGIKSDVLSFVRHFPG
jgi:[ribosomal protein S5]-alanine N-acetyltransferase